MPRSNPRLGPHDRGRGERRSPRLSIQGSRARARRERARRTCAPRGARFRPAHQGRGDRCPRKEGMGEPRVGVNRERAVGELADRRFDLLVIGGGIIGAANSSTRGARRSRGRARRGERLRQWHLERVLEADPRRVAIPPTGRRAPRARGALRASRADADRRAAPRTTRSVPVSALSGWTVPPGVRSERNRPLLDACALATQLARRHRPMRARACLRCGSTGSGRVRCTLTRRPTTPGSAS